MTFSENLYLGESMENCDLDTLKKTLTESPIREKVFLLTIASNPSEQLDILETKYLMFPYYDTHSLQVVGIAGSKQEAVKLVEMIAVECFAKRKDADLKAFLLASNP